MVRILKSMPIVEMNELLNESSEKRNSTQVLPTPESPISSSWKKSRFNFLNESFSLKTDSWQEPQEKNSDSRDNEHCL